MNVAQDEKDREADHGTAQGRSQGVGHGHATQDARLLVQQVEYGQKEHVEHVAAEHIAGGQTGGLRPERVDHGQHLGQGGSACQQEDADEHAAQAGAHGDNVAVLRQLDRRSHEDDATRYESEPGHWELP